MAKAILVLNVGSPSTRFAIFITVKADTRQDLAVLGQMAGIGQQARFVVAREPGSLVAAMDRLVFTGAQKISTENSPLSACAIPTNEELVIAQHAHAITQSMTSKS